MEEFNPDNIFTLPLVLRSNCSDSADSDSVNGLQVELTNGSNLVSKTLLVYQDTSILGSENGQGQPVVRILCEVDDNDEQQSINSCTDNGLANGPMETETETLSLTDGTTCSLSFANGDISETSEPLGYEMRLRDNNVSDDISNVIAVKPVDIDLFSNSFDEFIETVVSFQCRLCQHASNDKSDIIRHLKSFHLINNTQKEGMVILEGGRYTVDAVDVKKEKLDEDKTGETQTVYMCGKCSLPFETMSECKSHMSNHPKSKGGSKVNAKAPKRDNQSKVVHLTLEADKDVRKGTVFVRNLERENPLFEELTEGQDCPDLVKEKNIKCSRESCDLKFSTEDFMALHSDCHVAQGTATADCSPYKCCRCHYMFKKWSELALHLYKSHHIDLDLFKCSVCTFKSVSRLELRRHFKNHAVGDFYCTVCGKSFVAEASFKAHSSSHDVNSTSEKEKKKKKKVEECGECGLRLSSGKALKKHVKVVHGKLRPYVCQVCPFTSSTLATLRLHLRQHTGETPFTCDHCSFKTRDHNTMRRHRMRHSFVKPYSCKHCQFSSVQSTALKNHILKFHPESTDVFECSDCTFTTLSESLMATHRKVHHRDGRPNKISDEVDRDRNLSSMFPSSKSNDNKNDKLKMEVDDEESSSQCYFESEQHVDTGGITIPAEEVTSEDKCASTSQLNDPGGGVQTGGILVPNEDTMPLS